VKDRPAHIVEVLIFASSPKPYVAMDESRDGKSIGITMGPLREKLKDEVGASIDLLIESVELPLWSLIVHHITHACTEHFDGCPCGFGLGLPLAELAPVFIAEGPARSALSPMTPAQAVIENLCVAVIASGANFGAAPPRIERCVCPWS
jgi:hypothetical protein